MNEEELENAKKQEQQDLQRPQQQPQHQQQPQLQQENMVAANCYPKLTLPNMVDVNIEAYFMSMDFWFCASGISDDFRKYSTNEAFGTTFYN